MERCARDAASDAGCGSRGLRELDALVAIRSRRRAKAAGEELSWTRDERPAERSGGVLGDQRPGTNELEQRHGIFLPPHAFPLFENALRARLGRGLEEHRRHLGRLYQRFSRIAAGNPFAWFPKERSAEEIVSATGTNRMIAYPYTKYMNAIMEVDQGERRRKSRGT
jgi:acetyl-CoA acetyltransferase